jgi:hypothetical protein
MRTYNTHISMVRVGDLILHDGQVRTVCNKDLKYDSFLGYTLWGDSYKLGYAPVIQVIL